MKQARLSVILFLNLLSVGATAQNLTFSSSSLTFEATAGSSDSQFLTVTNESDSVIEVSGLGFSGADADEFWESNNIPIPVYPGEPFEIQVSFVPTSAGNKTATLTIASGEGILYEIALHGAADVPIEPKLVFSDPDTLAMGIVNLGVPGTKDIILTNEGNTDLLIDSLSAGNYANPDMEGYQFSLESTHTFPITLGIGESLTATIGFEASSPAATVEMNGVFEVESNDPNTPHRITLSAYETEPLIGLAESLDFGGIPFTEDTTAYLDISNNSTGQTAGDLIISNISFSGGGASVFSTSASFPIVIAPGENYLLPVSFIPGNYGDYEAVMNVSGNNSATVTLTGTGTRKYLGIPTAHDFGEVQYGVGSDYYTLTLEASGGEPVTVTGLELTGPQAADFSFHNLPATPFVIDSSTNLQIRIFTNASLGEKSATFTVTSDAENSPHEVSFTASVNGAILTSSAESVFINDILERYETLDSTITLSNTGNIPLDISSITLAGYDVNTYYELLNTPDFPFSLPGGEELPVSIRFKANAVSTAYGKLLIESNDPNSPKEIALEVTPVSAQIFTAQELYNLGVANINEDTITGIIEVQNIGSKDLEITELQFQQPANDFFTSETFPITIAPGTTREVEIKFFPESKGEKLITLVIASNASNDPGYTLQLSGTGTQATLSVQNSLDLGVAPTGTASDPVELFLQNTGDGDLRIDSIYIDGEGAEAGSFTITPHETPLIIAPNASSTISLSFTPKDAATYLGSLHIISNALNDHQTVSLQGEGFHAPLLEVNTTAVDFTGNVGDTAVYELLVQNNGTSPLQLFNAQFSAESSDAFLYSSNGTVEIVANADTVLQLLYVPREKGDHAGTFMVETNDPRTLSVDVTLDGFATAGEPSYSTNTLNFDITSIGSYDTLVVDIENTGDGDLRMIYDAINPLDVFQVVYPGHTAPEEGYGIARIAPGETQHAWILFHPAELGSFSSTVTLKQAAYDDTPISFEVNVSGESRMPPEIQVGGLTFTADNIEEDGDLRYLRGNVHAGKLRFGGEVIVDVVTGVIQGDGNVFVTDIPQIGEYGGEEVVLHDGGFEFKSGDIDDPQLYLESAFAGANAAFVLVGMPLQITKFELLDDGVRVGGKLVLPAEFGVDAGIDIDSLEITESNGVRIAGGVYLNDLKVMETFELKKAFVEFNTFENRFAGGGEVALTLIDTKVSIAAGVVIQKGGLDEVQLSIEVKPGVPLGATGWALAGGNGFISGIQAPPLSLGLGVDLVPSVPSGVEVVRLDNFMVSYTFGSTLSAEGTVQIFGENFGGGKVLVSSQKMSLSAFINLLGIFSGDISVAMLYENNKYSVEAAANLAVTIPEIDCFTCGAINQWLPYKIASVSTYFKDNRLSANVKVWILDIGVALIFEGGTTRVEVGFDATNLNGARIARLARSRNLSVSQEYDPEAMKRDKLEGQSIIFNARNSDGRVAGTEGTTEISFPFNIDQNYKTLMIRVEGPESVPNYSVVLPTGQEITAENAEELGYFHSVYEKGNMRYYAFNNVLTGNYELIIEGEGDYEIDFVGTGFRPGLTIENTGYLPDSGQLKIEWKDSDPDSDAKISLYYDNDGEGGDGIPIVRNISEDDAANSYTWNVDSLDNGEYYIYGVIDDGASTPVVAYASGSFVINKASGVAAPVLSEAIVSGDTLRLSWTPVADAENYLIFMDNDTLTYASENIGAGNNTSFNFTTLTRGRTYHFAVMAVLETGEKSALSNIISVEYTSSVNNNAPVISAIEVPEKARVGTSYRASVNVQDADTGDELSLTLPLSPEGMSISKEGVISWMPSDDQVGQHEVKVLVSDSQGAQDSLRFTLAVLDEQSAEGIISFDDFRYYGDHKTAFITLKDADLNLDAADKDEAVIQVRSTFDTGGKNIILRETGANTGVFTGQVTFNADGDLSSEGVIAVAEADTIYATYEDSFPDVVVQDFVLYEAALVLNRFPVGLELNNSTIPRDNEPGILIGTFGTTDPDDEDSHTYTLVEGVGSEDNALFQIDGKSLRTNDDLSDNIKQTYNIRVRSTDQKNGFYERSFNLKNGRVLGLEKASLHDRVSIYPNPSEDVVKITLKSSQGGIVNINVLSADGTLRREKQVYLADQMEISFDLSDLPAGIYLIRIEQNGEIINYKLIKR